MGGLTAYSSSAGRCAWRGAAPICQGTAPSSLPRAHTGKPPGPGRRPNPYLDKVRKIMDGTDVSPELKASLLSHLHDPRADGAAGHRPPLGHTHPLSAPPLGAMQHSNWKRTRDLVWDISAAEV